GPGWGTAAVRVASQRGTVTGDRDVNVRARTRVVGTGPRSAVEPGHTLTKRCPLSVQDRPSRRSTCVFLSEPAHPVADTTTVQVRATTLCEDPAAPRRPGGRARRNPGV